MFLKRDTLFMIKVYFDYCLKLNFNNVFFVFRRKIKTIKVRYPSHSTNGWNKSDEFNISEGSTIEIKDSEEIYKTYKSSQPVVVHQDDEYSKMFQIIIAIVFVWLLCLISLCKH